MDTGCTACVVLLTPTEIYCSNAGDSRGVLSKDKQAVPLSYDHKPGNQIEVARIKKANHFVEDDRVDGNLALSRAFGDF
jgi:serine/threonine protein phosphatase PrpC